MTSADHSDKKSRKKDLLFYGSIIAGVSILMFLLIAHDNHLPPFDKYDNTVYYSPMLKANATKSWGDHIRECQGIVFSKNGSKDLCLTNNQIYDLAKKLGATEMSDDYQRTGKN